MEQLNAAIETVRDEFSRQLESAATRDDLETVRLVFLSRKGKIAQLFEQLKSVPVADKPSAGRALNELRTEVQQRFDTRLAGLQGQGTSRKQGMDVTLPGRTRPLGTKHPITQTLEELKRIFGRMGFSTASGPEIEDDYHNFGALNFAPNHPARDMQDTFFVSKNILLRTHTSPVQIRVMEHQKPPVRIIAPGRVYRNEAVSARSHVIFHQLEGLYVDTHVTMSELKGTLVAFAKEYYGSSVRYKFRPTYFPFTEPSADMYVSCFLCGERGCAVCKYNGWLEILGSGMVHPHVLKNVGYDPEKVTGYAFGMGLERMTILRYQIDDIRLFFENDARFLRQF